ncbi:Os01g0649300 [Oryza sativa Japonica Group]|jgi:hypothetical protein|uniref:Os01g0649300 protein n=1 Tax=Oryza sativa subsp. japonica TaxID=39947 RepID=Q0JKU5_ORYSJ|nr:Os01g0649300 [Oryza sativa Japonica Group]|eukprot:NP_001043719.1 Os01g0649300 [Oryza sativa Japonica Group]
MVSSTSGGGAGLLSPPAVVLAVAVVLSAAAAAAQALAAPCYLRVFSFGDSLADTGNVAFLSGNDLAAVATLRRDLLPPRHRPVLRRPPHHRLHRYASSSIHPAGLVCID